MGGEYVTCWEMHGGLRHRNLKDREYFEELAVDRRIISKFTLKNQSWNFSSGLM